MIRAFIVDDEAIGRRELRRLLARHDDVVVVGEAASLADARDALVESTPSVMFLDVKLGVDNGFDLLSGVPADTAVVFVTAYTEHAADAFTANALDYLVKPVEPDRLAATVRRLRGRAAVPVSARPGSDAPDRRAGDGRRLTREDWVFLKSGEGRSFLRLSTITHIRADGDYSRVFLADGSMRRSGTSLGDWEAALPDSLFVRVHRGAIVNLAFVEKVTPWSNYGYLLRIVRADEPVIMSRRYAARVRSRLGA